jgi:hypothetical protein
VGAIKTASSSSSAATSVLHFCDTAGQQLTPPSSSPSGSLRRRRKHDSGAGLAGQVANENDGNGDSSVRNDKASKKIALILKNNAFLRFASRYPQEYLHLVGHLMVMFEMVAVLLPSIAIGISWITALCPDNPVNAFLDLIQAVVQCFFTGSGCDLHSHCILR